MIFNETPAVIGHRGSGSGQTENTIESMLAALAAGAGWLELDAQRTRDGTLVLRHDPTTAAGDFLIDRHWADCDLPALAEIFEALPVEAGINVDVKTILEDAVDTPHRRTGPLLVPLLTAEAARRPLLVTSFDAALLVHLREHLPGVPLGLLTWMTFPAGHAVAAAAGLGLHAVAMHTGSLQLPDADGIHRGRHRPASHTIEVAHQAGLDVLIWCPQPSEVAHYAAAGVDAVIVNDIPGAVTALNRT
jgi:glycerophosphoryl diester phosphodiesterase